MKKIWIAVAMTLALTGCSNKKALDIPTGTDVTVEKTDGVTVAGRLVEVKPDQVIVESRDGVKTHVQRSQIASMRQSAAGVERGAAKPNATDPTPNAAAAPPAAPAEGTNASAPAASAAATKPAETPADAPAEESRLAAAKPVERKPEYREVTLPSGTALTVELATTVGSDTSQIEDAVRGRLRNAVRVDGVEALPVGTAVLGHVTSVAPAGKVKGVASIAFRFSTLDLPGEGGQQNVSTATYSRASKTTKQKDATKIGVGAGAGAVIGGILGGGSGAAKGAAIGGGAGTAVVLSTKGDEVRIPRGHQSQSS